MQAHADAWEAFMAIKEPLADHHIDIRKLHLEIINHPSVDEFIESILLAFAPNPLDPKLFLLSVVPKLDAIITTPGLANKPNTIAEAVVARLLGAVASSAHKNRQLDKYRETLQSGWSNVTEALNAAQALKVMHSTSVVDAQTCKTKFINCLEERMAHVMKQRNWHERVLHLSKPLPASPTESSPA